VGKVGKRSKEKKTRESLKRKRKLESLGKKGQGEEVSVAIRTSKGGDFRPPRERKLGCNVVEGRLPGKAVPVWARGKAKG